ncbi:hypothetical protein A2U01_0063795, partial [Trifolium medium]|nr:hypothetical protein [Trifolium medium]
MEESSEKYKLVDTITYPELDWVGQEPRGIASVITPTAGEKFLTVEDGSGKNWELYYPVEGKRICSAYSEDGFAMYEFAFKELGFRLSFSEFAMGV